MLPQLPVTEASSCLKISPIPIEVTDFEDEIVCQTAAQEDADYVQAIELLQKREFNMI